MAFGLSAMFNDSKDAASEIDDLYRVLINLQQKYSFSLEIPRLVLLGGESAGKTTFLEVLAGFNVGFKQFGTASRCPTMLTLKKGLNQGERKITVDDDPVTAEELSTRIKKHMLKLGESFSDTPIRVEVESADVSDMVIYDMPGLILNPGHDDAAQRNAEQVARMSARYVRDPLNILVVVSKCNERVSSLNEISMVEDLATNDSKYPDLKLPKRHDWKRTALFAVNYVNQQFDTTFLTLQQANEFFEAARSQSPTGSQYFFMALRPTKKTNIDTMKFEESEEYYRNLPTAELEFYRTKVNELEQNPDSAGQIWNTDNNKVLGIKCVTRALQRLVREDLTRKLPAVAGRLKDLLEDRKKKIQILKQQLETSDPAKAMEMAKDMLRDFKEHFQRSIQGQEVRSTNFQQVCRYRARAAAPFLYTPEEYGSTYAEECERTPFDQDFGEWKGFISLTDLQSKEHLGTEGQQLGEILSKKLLGVSAYDRVLRIFEYMLLARNFDAVTNDEIYIAGHKGRTESQFPANEVVMQIAVRQLREATQGVEWLCKFIHDHFFEHAEKVFTYLIKSDEYNSFQEGVKDLLHKHILSKFGALVETRLEEALKQYGQLVTAFSDHRPVDRMRKQMMLLMVLSIKDMIPPQELIWPSGASSSSPVSGPVSYTTDYYTMADGMGAPPNIQGSFRPPAKQGKYLSQDEEMETGSGPASRNVEMLRAFRDFAERMEQFNDTFNIADIVAPGLQQVYPQDWNMIDYDYLRRCARKYYCSFVMELVEGIHRIWNTEFLHYFTSTHSDELGRDVSRIAEEIISLPEGEWKDAMGGQDPQRIESQISDLRDEIVELEAADRSLRLCSPRLRRTLSPPHSAKR